MTADARGGAAGVDRDDPRPLYAQLRDAVVAQIASHTLLPGDALPTESEFQESYGVARSVVRQALAELADAGVIHRRRGRGSVVALGGDYRRDVSRAGGLGEQMAAAGRALRTEPGVVARALPPEAARAALGTAETWQLERVRLVGDEPVVLVRNWVPVAVLPEVDRERLAVTALHDLMRERGHDPVGGRRHVQAVPADEYVARRLGVRRSDPVLLLEGVTRDAAGRGLEWFSIWHRPNTVFDLDARVPESPGAVSPGAVSPGAVSPGAVSPGAVSPGVDGAGLAELREATERLTRVVASLSGRSG